MKYTGILRISWRGNCTKNVQLYVSTCTFSEKDNSFSFKVGLMFWFDVRLNCKYVG